ncbi:MAG: low affinity iron permease family protein [Candidatus Saccharimonadales bacterium]
MKDSFRKIANKISYATGTATAFLLALLVILVWVVTGPMFDYSDTWQLIINTGTTIITFLMVFLIQNTQNRDGKAMQLKLDELIRATRARDSFMDIEELSDDELTELDKEFRVLHEKQLMSGHLKELHEKIENEHRRRQDLRTQASDVLNKLNPLTHNDKHK